MLAERRSRHSRSASALARQRSSGNGLSRAADARAVTQELLDLALVAVVLAVAVAQVAHPQMLGEARDGLPRRVAEVESRRALRLSVVHFRYTTRETVARFAEHLRVRHLRDGDGQDYRLEHEVEEFLRYRPSVRRP